MLAFADSLNATIAAGWVSVANPLTHKLSGTTGHTIVVNGDRYVQSDTIPVVDGKRPWRDLPEQQPHTFEQFLIPLAGKPNVPLISPRAAARCCAVMEALYAAARTHRWLDIP